jgi:hypothetical protein
VIPWGFDDPICKRDKWANRELFPAFVHGYGKKLGHIILKGTGGVFTRVGEEDGWTATTARR